MVIAFSTTEMPTPKPRVSFVIPEVIKEDLEKLAAMEDRSVSNYLLVLVRQVIEEAKKKGKLNATA